MNSGDNCPNLSVNIKSNINIELSRMSFFSILFTAISADSCSAKFESVGKP